MVLTYVVYCQYQIYLGYSQHFGTFIDTIRIPKLDTVLLPIVFNWLSSPFKSRAYLCHSSPELCYLDIKENKRVRDDRVLW